MRSRLDEAFDAVPRVEYLPIEQRRFAHEDRPLPIGYSATNSQPSTVRFMLQTLDAQPGDKVLDVGSGSGWTAALLGNLVSPGGVVVGVDIVPALVEMARKNHGNRMPMVSFRLGSPGSYGWPEDGPYDKILVSADAGRIPVELEEQLSVGGRMILPAAQRLWVVERTEDGDLVRHTAPGRFSFVPLR